MYMRPEKRYLYRSTCKMNLDMTRSILNDVNVDNNEVPSNRQNKSSQNVGSVTFANIVLKLFNVQYIWISA